MTTRHFHTLKFCALALYFALLFSLEVTAQLTIPLPGRRIPSKPKSASELLKEEANKPQSANGDENESMLNDFLGFYSHGWLPTPFPAQSIFALRSAAWIINDANNITFSSLPRINKSFSPVNPYSNDDDRKPRPRGLNINDTARAGEYYNSEYNDINLLYEIHLPVPLMLRVGVGYIYQRGVLFAKDRTMNALSPDNDGKLIPLQEFHTLDMQEHFLKGTLGVKIPIYGAFADMLDQRISSYYYLYLGAQVQHNIFNRAVQHAQLVPLDAGETRIRYGERSDGLSGERIRNGTDTLQVWNAPMPTLNTLRIQPEVAFGWGLSGEVNAGQFQAGLAVLMEAFALLPLQTVTSDAAWRQYIIGFRAAIGWHRRL